MLIYILSIIFLIILIALARKNIKLNDEISAKNAEISTLKSENQNLQSKISKFSEILDNLKNNKILQMDEA